MPTGRFVVDAAALVPNGICELPGGVAHQVRDVLRLGPGASLTLLDGDGGEWPATVASADRKRVVARLGVRRVCAAEPSARVVLCPGLLKAAKLEWVFQKGTELGITAFAPVICARGRALGDELGGGKRDRWRRILVEATEQCGRARVPSLADPTPLALALAELPPSAIGLMPWEGEHTRSLRQVLAGALGAHPSSKVPEVWIFIGPEGGFAAHEVALARERDVVPVTLGPRILRAESAAIVAAALALEACGELG